MKKIFTLFVVLSMGLGLTACGSSKTGSSTDTTATDTTATDTTATDTTATDTTATDTTATDTTATDAEESKTSDSATTLVVYFSATGNTKAVAEVIAEGTGADLFEIIPEEPYTEDDLNWNDNNSRSTVEMNDSSVRPLILETIDNIDQYSTIYVGYPIWWGEAPRILDTFVENYDFTGKTVISFCTSSSSGLGSSADNLADLAGTGDWKDGKRFGEMESADTIMEWVNGQ